MRCKPKFKSRLCVRAFSIEIPLAT
jgi:hypothetical protein